MAKEVKQWITIKGRHIPIFEGETVKDAVKRMVEKGRKHQPHTHDSLRKKAQEHKKAVEEYEKAPWKAGAAEKKVDADFKFLQEQNKGVITSTRFKKKESLAGNKEISVQSLKQNKGVGEYNGYKIQIGQNKDGSLGKRTMVMDPTTLKSKFYNSPEQAIEAAKKDNIFKDKTPKMSHEHKIYDNGLKATYNKQPGGSKEETPKKDAKTQLKEYQNLAAQKQKELHDFENTTKYRMRQWNSTEEERQAMEQQHTDLETTIAKHEEDARKLIKELQSKGELPKYSNENGYISDATVIADPRYKKLQETLPHSFKEHTAKEMMRRIMCAEEEGRDSFRDVVYDFQGGDRWDYTERTAHYKNKDGMGYDNFGQFLNDYKKVYRELGYKVTASENRDNHRRGYRTARGGWQSASHSQARMLTLEKIPQKPVKVKNPTPEIKTPVNNNTDTLNGKAIKSEMNSLYTLTGGKRDLTDAHAERINNFIKDYNANPDKYSSYKGAVNRVKKYVNENDADGKRFERFKEKTWQDKDAEIKAKQIENAEKQKAERTNSEVEKEAKKLSVYGQKLEAMSDKEFDNVYQAMRDSTDVAINDFQHHQSSKHPFAGSTLNRPVDLAADGKQSQYERAKELKKQLEDSVGKSREDRTKVMSNMLEMSKTDEDFKQFFSRPRAMVNPAKKAERNETIVQDHLKRITWNKAIGTDGQAETSKEPVKGIGIEKFCQIASQLDKEYDYDWTHDTSKFMGMIYNHYYILRSKK